MQKIEAAQFESLFVERLEAYEPDREQVLQEQEDQDQIVTRLREANNAFIEARRGDSSTKDREKVLQELENGYIKYKEIVSDLETGRKFYNELAVLVTRFREACKAQVKHRRIEAGQLEAEIASSAISSLHLHETSAALREQKRQEHSRATPPAGLTLEALAAPVPTRAPVGPPMPSAGVWSPDMGIRFGGPSPQTGGNLPSTQRRTNNSSWDSGRSPHFS